MCSLLSGYGLKVHNVDILRMAKDRNAFQILGCQMCLAEFA